MAENDARKAERNDGHYDERFAVRTQRNSQQHEHSEHGERETAVQRVQRLQLLLLFAAERVIQFRMGVREPRKDLVPEYSIGFPARNRILVDVRRHRHNPLTVLAADGRRRGAHAHRRHLAYRRLPAQRRTDHVFLDVRERVPLVARKPRIDPNLLPVALQPERFHAKKGSPHLPRHLVDRQAKRARFGP